MEILRANNKEIEDLLESLRVPRTEATTLEKPLTLEFTELIHEIVTILLYRDLGKLELTILSPILL